MIKRSKRSTPPAAATAHDTAAAAMPAISLPRRSAMGWHSRIVGLAKVVLPGTALAILAVVLLWPNIAPDALSRGNMVKLGLDALRRHEMTAPKYVGTDDKNRPYALEAKSARLANAKSDIVLLDQPKASITLEGGNWLAVTSRNGEYNQRSKQIDLVGDVNMFHDANYTFRTERASIDTAKNRAWGDRPVVASGPKGTIESTGFRVEDRGQTVYFTGKTRVILFLDNQDMKDLGGDTPKSTAEPDAPEAAPAERAPESAPAPAAPIPAKE